MVVNSERKKLNWVLCFINVCLACRFKPLSFVLLYFQQVKHIGATIYSSSRDKTIKAWQAHQDGNEPLLTFEGHRLVVTAIDLNKGKPEVNSFVYMCGSLY